MIQAKLCEVTHTKYLHCPYCGGRAYIKPSRYGYWYPCSSFPKCEASVGCHPNTTRPLGTLANRQLKDARMAIHRLFDPLWKKKKMKRNEAYKWFAGKIGISKSECHIALFDLEMCRKAAKVFDKEI